MKVKVKMPNGKVVEMEEQAAIDSGLEIIKEESVSTGFIRETGLKSGLTRFKEQHGSFDDYANDKLVEVMQGRSPKKGTPLITAKTSEGKLVLFTHVQLNEVQDNYPEIPFLINPTTGKIAQAGEPYHLNPQVVSSRQQGTVTLS